MRLILVVILFLLSTSFMEGLHSAVVTSDPHLTSITGLMPVEAHQDYSSVLSNQVASCKFLPLQIRKTPPANNRSRSNIMWGLASALVLIPLLLWLRDRRSNSSMRSIYSGKLIKDPSNKSQFLSVLVVILAMLLLIILITLLITLII